MSLKDAAKNAIASTSSQQAATLTSIQKVANDATSVLSADEIRATIAVNAKRAKARAELAGATMIHEYQGAMAEVMPVVATTLDEIDGFYFGAIYDAACVAYGMEPANNGQLPANPIKSALPEGK